MFPPLFCLSFFFLALFPFSDPSEAKIGYQFVLLPFYGCSMFFVLNIGGWQEAEEGNGRAGHCPCKRWCPIFFRSKSRSPKAHEDKPFLQVFFLENPDFNQTDPGEILQKLLGRVCSTLFLWMASGNAQQARLATVIATLCTP